MARDLRRLSVYLVLAFVVGLGAACGGSDDGDDDASTDPTTTEPTTTLSPEAQDEAEVRALMEDWYASIGDVYAGGEGAPEVTDFLTDEYQRQVERLIAERRSSGETYRRLPGSRLVIETVTVSDDAASITTCLFEIATRRAADEPAETESSNTYRLETDAIVTGEGWRLSDQRQLGTTEEGDQCPDT